MFATVMKQSALAGLGCSALITGRVMADSLADDTSPSDKATLTEIIVTATRRAESIDKIPVSITAFSQETMDVQGIKSIEDVARFTPGLNFASVGDGAGDAQATAIAIRGVFSNVGTSTTGLYIDDTPIQVRNMGFVTQDAFPQIFDLERVEVLKGPQGTLFGTGSMGGTVRFITPEPDLDKYSVYSRAEGSATKSGDPSYEMGVAAGGPLVNGTLAARGSVFYQSTGGFINQEPFTGTAVTNKGLNFADTTVIRGAAKWALSDALTITPAIYYQKKHANDPYFWLNESNPSETDFNTGFTQPQPQLDSFTLPSLKVDWKFDGAELISNTSFFYRKFFKQYDYSNYIFNFLAGSPEPGPPLPGYRAVTDNDVRQNSFTQEVRLQSTAADSRLQWVVGALFQSSRLYFNEYVPDPDLPALVAAKYYGATMLQAFGEDLVDGIYSYKVDQWTTDKQTAVFGQVDYSFIPSLKGTLGVRVAHTTFNSNFDEDGPLASAMVVRQVGSAPSANPVTPKIGLSYEPEAHSLYYLSAAKGTREGGANAPPIGATNPLCPGGDIVPLSYGTDSLWSYEIGAKNQFADGRLRTQASIYYIDWKNIQKQVSPNGCVTIPYTANLGSATVTGAELQAELRVVHDWSVFLAGGYSDARYTSDAFASPDPTTGIRPLIASNGDSLGVSPWNVTLSSNYDFVVGNYRSYFRVDYTYTAKNTGETPGRDPRNAIVYDPAFVADPAIRLLGARLGVRMGAMDISIFGRNLLNLTPALGLYHDSVGDPIFEASTVRPRTLGVTLTYRY